MRGPPKDAPRGRFDNAKRLRALASELEALSLDIAESAEGWI